MFDILIILFISIGFTIAAYSIRNVVNAMKFLRFPVLWRTMGLGFIGGTILSIGILFLYLGGVLDEYGWIIFIYPSIIGVLSIRAVYTLARKLHAG
ncbi:hypothetical protein ES703_46715 [subsurface metagenome]